MTETTHRHPFLDDLGDDVALTSSVLRQPARGRDTVLKIVKAGASQYTSQTPRFLGHLGARSYFEYDVDLVGGGKAVGLVAIHRDDAGKVTDLHIAFSPLGSVLALAAGVRDTLVADLGPDLFL